MLSLAETVRSYPMPTYSTSNPHLQSHCCFDWCWTQKWEVNPQGCCPAVNMKCCSCHFGTYSIWPKQVQTPSAATQRCWTRPYHDRPFDWLMPGSTSHGPLWHKLLTVDVLGHADSCNSLVVIEAWIFYRSRYWGWFSGAGPFHTYNWGCR